MPRTKGIGGHTRPNRGESDNWITPPAVLEALGAPDAFDLDPCACRRQPWPTAKKMFAWPAEDGFSSRWFGRVWLNPPYGPEAIRWLSKLAVHGCGTALIFARTETEMFHRCVWEQATAALFLRGRLFFHRPDGSRAEHNAGGPSVLVAYGARDRNELYRAVIAGDLKGWVVDLNSRK